MSVILIKQPITISFIVLSFFLSVFPVQAELVSTSLQGTVTLANAGNNPFGLSAGESVSASVTYDDSLISGNSPDEEFFINGLSDWDFNIILGTFNFSQSDVTDPTYTSFFFNNGKLDGISFFIEPINIGSFSGLLIEDFDGGTSLFVEDAGTGSPVYLEIDWDFANATTPAPIQHSLTVVKTGTGSGTVSSTPAGISCGGDCSELYNENTAVTLTASVTAGSEFTGWSGAGCSGTGTCDVTLSAAKAVTANFDLIQHSLTVTKTGTGEGSVSSSPVGIDCGADCSEVYNLNTNVTLTALAIAGSEFTGWSGAGCSGTGTCDVTLSAAKAVTANFDLIQHSLTVTKTGTGEGSVSSSPVGIDCGSDCSEDYNLNTNVILTALAIAGSEFTGWSGAGCNGTGTCDVTLSAAKAVTANFDLIQHSLTVTKTGTGEGSVSSSPVGIDCGADCSEVYNLNTNVTLTALAIAGSEFTGWSGAGCIGTGTCDVTLSAAKAVTANFDLIQHSLTVTKTGTGEGSVSSSPAGIDCGSDCSEDYNLNTNVILTALAAVGSEFTGWSGAGCNGTGTGTCDVILSAAKAVTANFDLIQHSLTVTKTGTGEGTVSSSPAGIDCGADCSELYNENTAVTLTAVADAGSEFTGWAGAGCSGTVTCDVTLDAAKAVAANFNLIQHSLTVSKTGTGGGTVSSAPAGINCGADCSEPYNENTSVTLTATADAGSEFIGWSGAGCSGTGTCDVTLDAAKAVTANFDLIITVKTLWIPIETGSDDAEENISSGGMSLTSTDLEMDQDGLKQQKVGLRFLLDIPAGATILNAMIQFTTDETSIDTTDLIVAGQATANASTFSNTNFDISNRTLTIENILWQPLSWNTKGEAGPDQQTPDLSTIIQEVVGQGGWSQGNAIVFIITGSGKRIAESYNGTAAPMLHVEFSTVAVTPDAVDDGSSGAPEYMTDINQTLTVPNGADDIVEHNDDVGSPAAEISSFGPVTGTESLVSTLGLSSQGGALAVEADGGFSYTPPVGFMGVDSFVYTLTNLAGSDTATVFINIQQLPELTTLWIPVATGSDDAEEKVSSGRMSLSSSDLELIRDGSSEQWVGVRFLGLNIPQGTTIVDAHIQFTADENTTETTELTVYAEDNANPLTFSTTPFDISDRLLTTTKEIWTPVPWNTNEQTSSIQATPNLAAIVQEVVNRADWEAGNPIVFITSGTGKRVAESYNGTAAPVFHVSFSVEPPSPKAPDAIDDGAPGLPEYTIGVNQVLTVDNGADDIVERNDSVGFPVAVVSAFDAASVQGGVVIVNADGGFSYTPPTPDFLGADSFSYTLTNSAGSDSATVYIDVVDRGEVIPLWIPVITGSDDAEQDVTSGNMYLGSSDLEMIMDKSSTQLVGVRFQGVSVPSGAVIERATIQFTTDEKTMEQTVLTIVAEANANAPTFGNTDFDIANRAPTATSVVWTPAAWNTTGATRPEQMTPDLSTIVQDVIDQGGWAQGNAIVFIISGSGNRVAESFEGTATPVLYIEYSILVP